MAVYFFTEDVSVKTIQRRSISAWIKGCISDYGKKCGNITIIFCSDEYLKGINIQYLKHDFYTDIITFNYNDGLLIHSDIFISTERVAENAASFGVSFQEELYRVIIHGILHLLGFSDETEEQKVQMRQLENSYLTKII
jgi:probable rRNA maturation factor